MKRRRCIMLFTDPMTTLILIIIASVLMEFALLFKVGIVVQWSEE
jgi:hypothetical protein